MTPFCTVWCIRWPSLPDSTVYAGSLQVSSVISSLKEIIAKVSWWTIHAWNCQTTHEYHKNPSTGKYHFDIRMCQWTHSLIMPCLLLNFTTNMQHCIQCRCTREGSDWLLCASWDCGTVYTYMSDILNTTFSNAFCWKRNCMFWFRFRRNLFLVVQLTPTQTWFG